MEYKLSLLQSALSCSVPLLIAELRQLPAEAFAEQWLAWSSYEAVRATGALDEQVIYREEGKTAQAFNGLAQAIAALAFCPGGITIFGQHWEATRYPDVMNSMNSMNGGNQCSKQCS